MKKMILLLLLFPLLAFANMAKPWIDGSEHSVLFGAENASVTNETIDIHLKYEPVDHYYFATYKIRYLINSQQKQTLPLLFIAINLLDKKAITVNSRSVAFRPLDFEKENYSFIKKTVVGTFVKFDVANEIPVNPNDLIYFSADLEKGDNIIEVEYDALMRFNTYGFVTNYKLEYSIAPSKFWKSFGPIEVSVTFDDKLEFKKSNLGKEKGGKNTLKWTITPQNREDLKIEVSEKTSFISKVLLALGPFGISVIALVGMFFFHLKLMKKHQKKYVMILGIILVPILYYVIYFLSFDLINFSLGKKHTKHGYVILYAFTFPFLLLIYGLLVWFINKRRKAKSENLSKT
ncbi:hypothetical protein LUD75_13870 [Epilithonimonas sp. JDS]|uniref:hypothetical protein n=1 Tax=Epilithonimonas sp. JDS TaxID=2902797 RepID=UPI001E58D636|nr:hypothetical protein [Epilithonimonas sp. JDS]MCD9855807.1 hypothetical protein [Epilithonimonas sp. JDS]